MVEEFTDFSTMWEQRLLAVAEPFIDSEVTTVEGSAVMSFSDDSTLKLEVNIGDEDPPRSGFFRCDVIAEYDYDRTDDTETVSRIWGQILNAFGDGTDGIDPLRERISSGRLRVPRGVDAIQYNRQATDDPSSRVKQFTFSAHLGITAPTNN